MRTLLYIGSAMMIALGIFCIANGSAAFISIAFIVGIIFVIIGILEIIIGYRINYGVLGISISLRADGVIMSIFGLVVIAGQVTDDTTTQMIFALLLIVEGALTINLNIGNDDVSQNTDFVISAALITLGLYMFFNNRLLNINSIVLVGAAIILLGLRRFRISYTVEYTKVGALSGNEEKLAEAKEEEKKALAKAKEGIREQKLAQKRIEKIERDIEQENTIISEATKRKKQTKNKK
ncbi:MAG: hypothetical protein Q4E61_01705 [Alphaproteobacteria bacterium]|nr:hypothetical protein [Alphaproteobacteria bacterium]